MKQYYTHIESVRRDPVDLTKLAQAALRLARERASRPALPAPSDEHHTSASPSPKPRRARPERRT